MSTSPSFIQHHHPLHHLFSPTTLKHDLSYVDKTYYPSTNNSNNNSTHPASSASHHNNNNNGNSSNDDDSKIMMANEKTQLSITRMHDLVFNRALGMISTVSRLDLQNVGLFSLPEQIATLSRLTVLDLSHNCLETLPTALKHLKHLRQLNVAHNRLHHTPDILANLHKLTWLDLSHNSFRDLTSDLSRLERLTWLDLSHCTRLDAIPAELLSLPHVTIKTEGCSRMQRRISKFQHSLAHNPPSLVEICARHVKKQQQQQQQHPTLATNRGNKSRLQLLLRLRQRLSSSTRRLGKSKGEMEQQQQPSQDYSMMPAHLSQYLSRDKACFYCGGPYFDSPVIRYRIILHQDGNYIPVKYNLCAAHWSSDTDRVLALFSHQSL
ncbi:predicted protein [Lichtheimia corymbifera JMRC:FSU:9682]|uniref:L domain-like protein n=1 Tax=Lichtheimia corymbifera JMRC:FSU:9682 TaxID=1263082 RepID=A0A068RH10_9FUNG|nr:predicted protein [Lichtheimia corymbifera JMRC:FSU:9682]